MRYHALECMCGGLIISRHNEIRYELSNLASKAFFPLKFVTNQEFMPVNQPLSSKRAQLFARKTVTASWFEAFGLTGLTA
jgi:hypothetical protein